MRATTTSQLDADLADKWSSALFEFYASPQHELIKLIGAYACGGVWDNRMSEMYVRAESFANAYLHSEEIAVIVEVYERITIEVNKDYHRTRTQE